MSTVITRQRNDYYARHHQSAHRAAIGITMPIHVPENIERREVHAPCFKCEARGACRHRPWLLTEAA